MNLPLRYSIAAMIMVVVATLVGASLSSMEAPEPRHYVGQESCMSARCHAGAYSDTSDYKGAAPFRETMHQKIHLRPSPETVVIDKYFEGDSVVKLVEPTIPVDGKDTLLVCFSKSADRKDYFIQLKFSGGGDSTGKMKVAYTYGGNGWIQRFLVQIGDLHYVTPFQYVLPAYRERSDTSRTFFLLDRDRWYFVDATTQGEARFYNHTSTIFKSKSWDRNCAFCHVNGFDLARTTRGMDTVYAASWVGVAERDSALKDQNIRIGCESCHGPGSEHVRNPRMEGSILNPNKWDVNSFEMTDIKLDLCGQCHNRMLSSKGTFKYPYDETARLPFLPGDSLSRYTSGPFKGMDVWADGLTSKAHHQTGQDYARSKEYASHVFKNGCWDCHTVHSNKPGLPYQLDRDWYTLQQGQGCLECHNDKAATSMRGDLLVNTHTQHSIQASQCVNCHFTKTATISFRDLPRKPYFEFSLHNFKVLRPTATIIGAQSSFNGVMNTCAEACHRNGRGTRNFADTSKPAPDYGILDRELDRWAEGSDVRLADSLWYHYQRMYSRYFTSTRVDDHDAAGVTRIASVAPNPVRSTATIRYALARAGSIRLEVYDLKGGLVKSLASGRHEAGSYVETWDATDEIGAPVESGTYLLRLKAGRATSSMNVQVRR